MVRGVVAVLGGLLLLLSGPAFAVDDELHAVPATMRPYAVVDPNASSHAMGSQWSRGNDDPEENNEGNFSTGTLYSTLVGVEKAEGLLAEIQFLALPYNHSVRLGESQNFCMREMQKWYQLNDNTQAIKVEVDQRKRFFTGTTLAADWTNGCLMVKYLPKKARTTTEAKNRLYTGFTTLGNLSQDGSYWGEFWIEMGAPQALATSESQLAVKHKMFWYVKVENGKFVGGDVQMVNPDGQGKVITDTLRYRGHYSASGEDFSNLIFRSYEIKPLETPFPWKQ